MVGPWPNRRRVITFTWDCMDMEGQKSMHVLQAWEEFDSTVEIWCRDRAARVVGLWWQLRERGVNKGRNCTRSQSLGLKDSFKNFTNSFYLMNRISSHIQLCMSGPNSQGRGTCFRKKWYLHRRHAEYMQINRSRSNFFYAPLSAWTITTKI